MQDKEFTIRDFQNKYPNDDVCLDRLFSEKYSVKHKGICPHCKKQAKYYRVKNRKCYSCEYCGHQIYPLVDTIFKNSKISLYLWFYVIYLFSTSKNGISAKEIQRQTGLSYKSCWLMGMKIRALMKQDDKDKFNQTVEIDETYIGGKEIHKHFNKKTKFTQGRSTKVKVPVIGAIERETKQVVAKVVNDVKIKTIYPFMYNNIDTKATINTDDYRGYINLSNTGYENHHIVVHSQKKYAYGDNNQYHTNTIEGFWSQLKRSLDGTFHKVSRKYLQKYVDEFCFRYNNRKKVFKNLEYCLLC